MGKVPSGLLPAVPHHSSSQASLLPLAVLAPLACLLCTVQRTSGFSEVSLAWDSGHGPRHRPAQLLQPLFPVHTCMFSLSWAVYSLKLPAGGRWRFCLQEPWPRSVSANGQKPPGGGDRTRARCASVELGLGSPADTASVSPCEGAGKLTVALQLFTGLGQGKLLSWGFRPGCGPVESVVPTSRPSVLWQVEWTPLDNLA